MPTGYVNAQAQQAVVFSVKLTSILGIIYDSVNNIPVLTGNSDAFYPTPDSEDPSPGYLRGYYFNGKSSVLRLPEYKAYVTPALVLAPTWGMELILMPASLDGSLMYSVSSNHTMFSISLSKGFVVFNIFLEETGLVSVTSNSTLNLNQWNTLYVSISYNSGTIATIYTNKAASCVKYLGKGIFVNVFSKTSITVAGTKTSFYKGFIFSVQFDTTGIPMKKTRLLKEELLLKNQTEINKSFPIWRKDRILHVIEN